uniref:Uncharacterized protein n=1 Tax=Siphoviridae sp. ctHSY3 TaxID=2825421 RepID=A0A8S5TUW2_9CAUD|nr:MAG TPA: hypothetical protein [Siphoviridae sp. ctHSY3]
MPSTVARLSSSSSCHGRLPVHLLFTDGCEIPSISPSRDWL